MGNAGLTVNEQRSHFALWSLLKSPLFIGADLRSLSREAKEILTAAEVIAVNQDPLGVAGDLVWKQGPLEVSAVHTVITALIFKRCHFASNCYYTQQLLQHQSITDPCQA